MPPSIKLFEQLFVASLFIGVIQSALMVDINSSSVGEVFFVVIFQVLMLSLILALVLLVSRKKSAIAKWVLTIGTLAGLIFYIPALAVMFEHGARAAMSVCQLGMQAYGLYLLFSEESRSWLERREKEKLIL